MVASRNMTLFPLCKIISFLWLIILLMVPASAMGGNALKSGAVFWDCPVCPQLVVVPAGAFVMGAPFAVGGDDEMPIHHVRIWRKFAIGRYEVTRHEFKAFVAATGYRIDGPCRYIGKRGWAESDLANYHHPFIPQNDDHPVVCVNWHDAKAYVAWLSRVTGKSYRLPSEAEWEYAAQGGAPTLYHFGTSGGELCAYGNGADADSPMKGRNNECRDGHRWGTARAGSYRPNAFGLYDTIGNVKEWVEDCWNDTYKGAPMDGAPWKMGNCRQRVHRGGSWLNLPIYLRSAARLRTYAGYRYYDIGFRVVRSFTQ